MSRAGRELRSAPVKPQLSGTAQCRVLPTCLGLALCLLATQLAELSLLGPVTGLSGGLVWGEGLEGLSPEECGCLGGWWGLWRCPYGLAFTPASHGSHHLFLSWGPAPGPRLPQPMSQTDKASCHVSFLCVHLPSL